MKLLIVEDSEADREIARRYLKKYNLYQFYEEELGDRGLERCHQIQPDCILLDYNLPDMEGSEFLDSLTGEDGKIDYPVVVLTGGGDEMTAVQVMKHGAEDYLAKSWLTPELLHRTLQNALQKHQMQKNLDAERHRNNAELEKLVAERTEVLTLTNARLATEIAERKQAQEVIKTSLKEKEALLKEVHHRVKNNLQVISSLLRLQSDYITDPVALAMFKESQNRVKSMALVHEKLYSSDNFANINFTDYIQSLSRSLFQSYNIYKDTVHLEIGAKDVELGIDKATTLGLIVNELISNALKYAFPQGRKGRILVKLISKDNHYCLEVSDDGIGFPDKVDFRDTTSLGMQLICTLTEQLEGEISLERQGGTTFKITFTDTSENEKE